MDIAGHVRFHIRYCHLVLFFDFFIMSKGSTILYIESNCKKEKTLLVGVVVVDVGDRTTTHPWISLHL